MSLELKSFVTNLLFKHPALRPRHKELEALFLECADEDERDCVYYLLDRFRFVSLEETLAMNQAIYKRILNDCQGKDKPCVCGMGKGNSPDSSHTMANEFKEKIAQDRVIETIYNYPILDNAQKAKSNHGFYAVFDNLAASGKSAIRIFNQAKRVGVKIKFYFQFCSIEAVSKFRKKGLEFTTINYIDKGISHIPDPNKREKYKTAMERLESRLCVDLRPGDKGGNLLRFGYGRAEVLLYYVGQNCLNSTFPIFYWPKDNNGRNRQTLFHRY